MVPWFREQALQLKRQARRSERNGRRHKAECLAEMRLQHKTYKNYLDASKTESINETIDDFRNNQRPLFNAISHLIGNRKSNPLPECSSNTELANDFANFFYDKGDKIRKDMDDHEIYRPPQLDVPQFTEFPVSRNRQST